MKTKEELNSLKQEVETLNKKLTELSDEELGQVIGGVIKSPKLISPILRLLTAEVGGKTAQFAGREIVLHDMPQKPDHEKYIMK